MELKMRMEIFFSLNYQFRKHTCQYKSKTNSFSCSGLVEFTFEIIHVKNSKRILKRE